LNIRPACLLKTSVFLALAALALTGCLPPRALPLRGALSSPHALPTSAATLAVGYHRIRFRWQLKESQFSAKGDGAARAAFPDSARFDFVASGPLGGSGVALLFDDTLVAPGGKGVRKYLPPTPFLWAALGRLAVPPASDTVVRVDGDTVRADIGRLSQDGELTGSGADSATIWRVAFAGGELASLARLSGGRVRGTVVRDLARGRIKYDDGGHRSLTLTQVRIEAVPAFDLSVWNP
jgi:hypothetical protein